MPTSQYRSPGRRRTLGALVTIGAGTLLLSGCAGPAASGTSGSDAAGGPRIVATTTQIGDFVHELLGDTAEVTQLLSPGQSAHSFDPSAAQLLALADADAVVMNGAGLESWLDDALDASGFDGVLIDASTGIELFGTDDHDHGEADDDTDTDAHDETDDHDHAGGNPHIWTDPELAVTMVENIGAGLEGVAGVEAAALEKSQGAYVGQLNALDDWIEQSVDVVPESERLLVTNHDAFTYYIDAYDLVFVGSVIPSFDDNAEPSAKEIDRLVADIEATGTKAVFSEASISPKAAEAIGTEAGVSVYSGPDALYGDSLGAAGTEGETYLGSQIHNTRLIVESWGVEPSALPSALQ